MMHMETSSPSAIFRGSGSRPDRCLTGVVGPEVLSTGSAASTDFRFRRAVCRVLIALSFKSFRRRNERYRRRERSDCSEARILPVVEEERPSEPEDPDYISNCRRRNSSCGGGAHSSQSDDSDVEPSSELHIRRGRRQAIFDGKSLGLVADGGDLSPTTSCDEGETSNNAGTSGGASGSGQNQAPCDESASNEHSRRRSSADLEFYYPGDLLSQARVATGSSSAVAATSTSGLVDPAGNARKKATAPLLKRNTIADFANTKAYQESTASLISASDQDKKVKNTFSLLKLIDKKPHRSKDNLIDLTEVLQSLKPSEFKDSRLISYKNGHWVDLLADPDDENTKNAIRSLTETERKRREAVWELFNSECVFLIDHLMVLKHCFMEPLKKVQVEGHLMFAEPHELFGNLDELCYVSYTFSRDFITLLLKDGGRVCDFGKTSVLVKALRRFSQLSRDGEVYHDYCLNYSKAMTYLDNLRKNDDFCEFEKWCGQDARCHRLQLTDLLISPMQHCTKVPLLLNNISRYTVDPIELQQLSESLRKLEASLENLEAKMMWLKNFERIQEIQQQIIWQPITELEPRAFIPEFLRGMLSRQPCERLLSSTKRRLLHEGPVTLLEISKAVDMYMFLFDDILLLTRVKKPPRKKANPTDQVSNPYTGTRVQTDGALFVVYRQPMALDRFAVHDVRPSDTSVGVFWDYVESGSEAQISMDSEIYAEANNWCLPHIYDDCSPSNTPRTTSNLLFGCVSAAAAVLKNAFVLVQVNRFQQIIGVYTIQAPSYGNKATWLSRLHEAQESYREACRKPDVLLQSTGNNQQSSAQCPCPVDSTASPPVAGVNINVLQCEENASFTDSIDDVTATGEQMIAGFSSSTGGPIRLPNEALLGVPRAGYQHLITSPTASSAGGNSSSSTDAGTRSGRTVRSSSSDAAAELRQDSSPQSPTASDSNQPRRTSDPLGGVSKQQTAATAASGTETAAGGGQEIEIVVSPVPAGPVNSHAADCKSMHSAAAASLAENVGKCPSSSYLAVAPPPFGLSPIPVSYSSSAFDYLRSSSLHHLPSTGSVLGFPTGNRLDTSSLSLAPTTESSSSSNDSYGPGVQVLSPSAAVLYPSISSTSLHPPNPFQTTGRQSYDGGVFATPLLPPPPATISHSRSSGVVGPPHRVFDELPSGASTPPPFQSSISSENRIDLPSRSSYSLHLQSQHSRFQRHHQQQQQQQQLMQCQLGRSNYQSSLSSSALYSLMSKHRQASAAATTANSAAAAEPADVSDSSDDDSEPSRISCAGASRRPGNGFRLLDRSSESTPLLCHAGRHGTGCSNAGLGGGSRRVEVPTTLVCCTPPRRRPHPNDQRLLLAAVAAAVPPSPTSSPPTDNDDIIGFCGPLTTRDDAVVTERRRTGGGTSLFTSSSKWRRGGSLKVRSRSRTVALINAAHEKSQSIDIPD